jgi:hypothetical protein
MDSFYDDGENYEKNNNLKFALSSYNQAVMLQNEYNLKPKDKKYKQSFERIENVIAEQKLKD